MPPKAKPKSLTARELNRSLALYAAAAPNPARAAEGDALLRRPERAKRAATGASWASKGASESQVLNAVLGFLRRHPAVAMAWRNNVGMAEFGDQPVMFGFVGLADISFVMRGGRAGFFEVKREIGGRVSEAQAHFIAKMQAAGAIAGVVRSVDEAVLLLKYAVKT